MSTCLKLTCPHCDAGLEVEGEVEPGEAVHLSCPHCHHEITISGPPVPEPPLIPPPIPTTSRPVWFGSKQSLVEVRLISGSSLRIRAVKLYSESRLQELAAKKAAAAELLGGVQSPFGFIGNGLEFFAQVFAARALEDHYSNKAAKQGIDVLREVFEQEKKLRGEARFFPVGQIQEIEHPCPQLWRVPSQPSGFVHSGDEFVSVEDEHGGPQSIQWKAVEFFKYCPNG